ncbi:hypothetical protein VNO77_02876 [Canavalia gladiata]|uniref:Uncharacterized protein n=1 Tax=Canavalia gladiata TaxID=3824 RepID=A0AAN9R3E2_CANGL
MGGGSGSRGTSWRISKGRGRKKEKGGGSRGLIPKRRLKLLWRRRALIRSDRAAFSVALGKTEKRKSNFQSLMALIGSSSQDLTHIRGVLGQVLFRKLFIGHANLVMHQDCLLSSGKSVRVVLIGTIYLWHQVCESRFGRDLFHTLGQNQSTCRMVRDMPRLEPIEEKHSSVFYADRMSKEVRPVYEFSRKGKVTSMGLLYRRVALAFCYRDSLGY